MCVVAVGDLDLESLNVSLAVVGEAGACVPAYLKVPSCHVKRAGRGSFSVTGRRLCHLPFLYLILEAESQTVLSGFSFTTLL